MWIERLSLRNLRILETLDIELGPGLNVFVGANAQGKTSILEGAGFVARARSFRSDDSSAAIRRGAPALAASGLAVNGHGRTRLDVEINSHGRRLRIDGRPATARDYNGRLEVAVYSTERLRLVRGSARDRRELIDRAAAPLWPAYRRELADFGRTLAQRNALLAAGGRELDAWSERFAQLGARVRLRRAAYAARLTGALAEGFRPSGESYVVRMEAVAAQQNEDELRRALEDELRARRGDERRAGRTLVGPQRDRVQLLVDGQDIAGASAGQARSLLLALTIAALDVYAAERGDGAVALLDDLDSELDEARLELVCAAVARRGQALITTAHPGWAERRLGDPRLFRVERGGVRGQADSMGRA